MKVREKHWRDSLITPSLLPSFPAATPSWLGACVVDSGMVGGDVIVARPEKHIPASLEEAVAELKRDPHRAVHARVGNLDVEIRVVADETGAPADIFAGAGPWQGETTEDLPESSARSTPT